MLQQERWSRKGSPSSAAPRADRLWRNSNANGIVVPVTLRCGASPATGNVQGRDVAGSDAMESPVNALARNQPGDPSVTSKLVVGRAVQLTNQPTSEPTIQLTDSRVPIECILDLH
jgi:hypothetical protein